jgi:CRISPR-associated endonuclease/helicase Cas3
MTALSGNDFPQFFKELHDKQPFPWQATLAEEVCAAGWPEVIDLPTASGKTACLDIALFALAVKERMPRRIFFVVDRRVIVNEAFLRMQRVASRLAIEEKGVVGAVAAKLRTIAGDTAGCPLDVHELRGGMYRDPSWVRSPLQPTVIASTVDQVGSRLLFRGYGVSPSAWPIHAALIANDALIFLDEAHCSRAFAQTLGAIRRYRSDEWAETPLERPFAFVEMTATPAENRTSVRFSLTPKDPENPAMHRRLFAAKPTALHVEKCRANDLDKLASALESKALCLAEETGAKRIAVMVNRIATARKVFGLLSNNKKIAAEQVHLLIGRMRPLDRGDLVKNLEPLKAGAERSDGAQRQFVVATQCLEVGADLDFDVLVSECASIDALLQRFGRLDRLGKLDGRARGCIVISAGAADAKEPDAIYGESLKETWRWLSDLAGETHEVNMGIESLDSERLTVAQRLKGLGEEDAAKLRRLGPDAPALLPAHLDAWAQTSPRPYAEPDPALFLHGLREGSPDVQVVWRADLNGSDSHKWQKIVSLCPPVSAEAMPVRLAEFKRWMTGDDDTSPLASDLEGTGAGEDSDGKGTEVLIWRGDQSSLSTTPSDIGPGDTLVLPLSSGGWKALGHIPEPVRDVADSAILEARRRVCLRLHPQLWPSETLPTDTEGLGRAEWLEIFKRYVQGVNEPARFMALLEAAESAERRGELELVPYPSNEGVVLRSKRMIAISKSSCKSGGGEEDSGHDEISREGTAVSLEEHTTDVRAEAVRFVENLAPGFVEMFGTVADFHDAGKADLRFQAMLHGGDRMAAEYSPRLLAKGAVLSGTSFATAKKRSGLPPEFRHELVSLHFAKAGCRSNADLDPILHLIGSHHGYCRPFAPVVLDPDGEDVHWREFRICKCEREREAAHRLSSGVARRFWSFTRRFGWWGGAYLEAVFRLGDWRASEREQEDAR